MDKGKKILAVDGGGIQVICSAMILAEIERLMSKPIATLFDLVAGTSSGGILTLGLTKADATGQKPQYTAQDGVNLYTQKGDQIFTRSLWHKLLAFGNIFDEKYSAVDLEKTLKEFFGESSLSDALTDVLITSYDIERREAFFFKKRKGIKDPKDDFFIRDVARATTAAPTYFEPAHIQNKDKSTTYALIDGAVFANNPAMCAYAEIRSIYPQSTELFLLSIGTNGVQKSYSYQQAKNWGILGWAVPVIDTMFDGINDTIDYQLKHIFMSEKEKSNDYTRIVIPIERTPANMDDISANNIAYLQTITKKYISENGRLFEEICKELTT